ncbi:MAG: ATP-binding protein [Verrucomicrobiota bacterium]
MASIFALIFLLAAIVLWLRYRRLITEIDDLGDAVDARRNVLLAKRVNPSVQRLFNASLKLVEENSQFNKAKSDHLTQIETTFGNIQEAVLILNPSNYIVLANQAARNLLAGGASVNGQRVERVLRSASFLDYVNRIKSGQKLPRQEVEVIQDKSQFWFEVSGTVIVREGGGERISLFVLHDITRLRQLEKMRKEFVANVSHELRTPLTVIKGYCDTLVDDHDQLDGEARGRFLSKIQKNVERLHILIEDLLTLSRLESNPEQLRRSEVSLGEIAEEIRETFQRRLSDETRRIEVLVDEALPEVIIDAVKISQVFENLLENAFRYAGDFTKLEIRVRRDLNRPFVVCSVKDDGVGIPEQDLPHLFERFYRVDKGRSRDRGGTGLGLSIVKHIVQLHGGYVSVESEVGFGSEFSFSLPVRSL